MRPHLVVALALVTTPSLASSAPAAPSSLSSPALDLVASVARGCAPRLVGDARHPFVEAQAACDAYLAFALVDEALALAPGDVDGKRTRAAAIDALVDDQLGRGAAVFASAGPRALVTAPGVAHVPKSVLWRGYALVMLAGLARLDALTPERAALFDAIAQSLVEDLNLADAGHTPWLESFRGGVWPCDHALAAAGLVLHGALRGSSSSTRVGLALAARLDALRVAGGSHGFPARVDARGRVLEPDERGTVLAWTAGFLGIAGLVEADRFAQSLVDDLCDDPAHVENIVGPFALTGGLAACREWPRGSKRGADAVSGPIVGGYGTGASALAIAATRITKRDAWAAHLEATAALSGAALGDGDARPLERAILAWAAGARPWL